MSPSSRRGWKQKQLVSTCDGQRIWKTSEPAHSSTVHANLARIAQFVVRSKLPDWSASQTEKTRATRQDTIPDYRTTNGAEHKQKKTPQEQRTTSLFLAHIWKSTARSYHQEWAGDLTRQPVSTDWVRVVVGVGEVCPLWTVRHSSSNGKARSTTAATTLNFFARWNPPASPDPRRRRRSVNKLGKNEGTGVRGRTKAESAEPYHRPRNREVP